MINITTPIFTLILLLAQGIGFSQENITKTDLPAFPGAEGFGANTPGGRGGAVLFVDNLKDYDPSFEKPLEGTLRKALEAEGPRIVIFRVSGYIDLVAPLILTKSQITIAGQTAPGEGICLRGNSFIIKGKPGRPVKDIIVRHLRIRPGDKRDSPGGKAPVMTDDYATGSDGITIDNARNIIIDHCSVSWAVDENMQITASENLTIQNCIISEALHKSVHFKSPHSKGVIIGYGANKISFHRNLIMHCADRNPYFPAEGNEDFVIDFRNNVVYNWWINAGVSYPKSNHQGRINFIGNTFIPGINSWEKRSLTLGVNTKVYARDNFGPYRTSENQDEFAVVDWEREDADLSLQSEKPFITPQVNTIAASEVLTYVLKNAGATKPCRDGVDLRLIEEVKLRQGKIIDHPSEVGGWPLLRSDLLPQDTDSDGIPDQWEKEHQLDPHNPNDAVQMDNENGYCQIEIWMNSINGRKERNEKRIVCAGKGTKKDPVQIPYSRRRINVNGYPDEWEQIPFLPRVYENREDGSLKLAWREEGLYGFVYVQDSLLQLYEAEPYRGDCFELFIDRLNEKSETREESCHSNQVIFSPSENLIAGNAALSIPRNWPTRGTNYIFSQWRKTDSGYHIEFVLPDVMMNPAKLKVGEKIGINYGIVNDGKTMEHFYVDKSSNAFYPANWGTIILTSQ
ncbi:MAG: sugar-binding protein [Bacteroidales bacterium]